MNERNNNFLKQLITLSGSQKQLAKLLGVHEQSINDWLTVGKISKKGAALVEASKVFGSFFKAPMLRPDINPRSWTEVLFTPTYEASRRKQVAYEHSKEFKTETPLAVLEGLKK